ncbi:MAG: AraC family transcriptional regulator ligand-binding domain-containing protein [Acidobacteriota bacterium]
MSRITSLFVRKVLAQVHESLDGAALARSVGIELDAPTDPSSMVDAGEYYDLLERIAADDPEATTLPLRVGESMRCDEYGAFGLAWKSATDLRGSFERAERYARVLTNVATYTVETTDAGSFMHLHRDGERRLGLRLSNENTIAAILSISRQVSTRDVQPIGVYFKHPAPSSISGHEAYFGCPVHFATDRDALCFTPEALRVPNHLGDASISRFFDTHLDAELAKLDDATSLERRVQIRISRSLSEGVPTMSDVARHVGMSARTLQRRLSERGRSFQSLVDEARPQLAERLLRETDYSLAEVAFMTGFAEQSSFTRAFKRWAGRTPRSYRLDP